MNTEKKLDRVRESLREGKPVLLYDFDEREGETDIVYPAETVTYEDIVRLRRDAGGLICTAIHPDAADELGLPYMHDVLDDHPAVEHASDLGYDNRSSFSLWVNHKSTYTGITDKDRAKTSRRLANAVLEAGNEGFEFSDEFRTPGHMAVLRAADGLLDDRQGQTEMSVKLMEMAGLVPAAVICEMMDAKTGEALDKQEARRYSMDNDLVFIEGDELAASEKTVYQPAD
ncbi:MAG: 3,4-dihydroxy-2-butanone-4-phosphate synthase [Halobacteria archaeon]